MCGICGAFDTDMQNRGISQELINKMTAKLVHRGPDAMGSLVRPNIALGFTRLSIIDLDGGMQPLLNEDESLVLICNGEIFNYKELREELTCKGHRFKTNTDVEVILHLYEEYPGNFLLKLNGQFAFIIFDLKNMSMLCARDHAGIIPFFYTISEGVFLFASEIKAILEYPGVRREVDLKALDQLMTFPGIASPRTMFAGIHSLQCGSSLLVRPGGILEENSFWRLEYPKEDELEYSKNENYYVEKLDALLTAAIKRRLQADVPVGFYISGGLDSTLIASKVTALCPSESKHSFSIDFAHKGISENKFQEIAVQHVKSHHHSRLFGTEDICRYLTKAVYYSESALKETYNTASMVLSEMAREHGTKVILTGEGADELFAGYVGYKFDRLRAENPLKDDLEEQDLRGLMWGDKSFMYEKNYGIFEKSKGIIYSPHIRQMQKDISCLNHRLVDNSLLEARNIIHKRSFVDYYLRLSNHLIADHGDRMSYSNSVEARYPFLDIDLINFTTRIPPDLKLKDMSEKYILKKVAQLNGLPQEIIKRPKFSFVAPGSSSIIKQNKEFVEDILSYNTVKRQGYFDPDTVEALKKQYMKEDFSLNVPFESDLLIILLTFGIFLNEFKMPGLK